uniref:B1 homeodomain mating type protein n=1 Tax=Heterobasidion parviporum TaxID=207832 RepID=S5RW71_9AGAM|nr:b1 homeodomain mating type protein [Heterobasidion parviporum]
MPRHRLYSRLQHAQNRLLSALLEGPDALDAFQKSWLELANDLEKDTRMNLVDDETLAAAHGTASIVSTLAGSFLRLTTTSQDIHQSLMKRLDITLDGSKTSIVASSRPTPTLFPIEAYEWLLQNLHNPLPSGDVKAELAAATGHTVESIASWLQSTREEIGWTTLARYHFNNSRSALIDAAYRALCQSDSSRPLPPYIAHAFLVVKRNLERLHNNKLTGKVGSHDAPQLVDGNPEIIFGSVVREELDRELTERNKSKIVSQRDVEPVSVSTASNPSRVLQLPQWNESDEEDEEDLTPPPPIAGIKRRADNDYDLGQTSDREFRTSKRHKSSSSPDSQLSPLAMHAKKPVRLQLSLPQPDTSTLMPCTSQTSNCISLSTPSYPPSGSQMHQIPAISRKRRLSDASCDVTPKRPRHIHSGPRTQAVSDPLPHGVNVATHDNVLLESWCQTNTNPAIQPSISDLLNDSSPATTALNTPWTDTPYSELPVLPSDFLIPSQKIVLSDEDFGAMLSSSYDMSSNFIPVDHDIFETLSSLDELFPPSFTGLSSSSSEESIQGVSNPKSGGTSGMENMSSFPTSLDEVLSSPSYRTFLPIPSSSDHCQETESYILSNEEVRGSQDFGDWASLAPMENQYLVNTTFSAYSSHRNLVL